MISQIRGTLVGKELDRVEVMSGGGVAYELQIPLTVFEKLPREGDQVTLHAWPVVKEDSWQLFGFSTRAERRLFQKLLTANGVGPALALGLMSALSAHRLVQAILEKDVATLQRVPRVGRKKAERLVLDLADKLDGVGGDGELVAAPAGGPADEAIRALISLGYTRGEAEKAVRRALDSAPANAPSAELIRASLAQLAE